MNKANISFQLYTARKFQPLKMYLITLHQPNKKHELFALADFDEKS